MQPRKWHYHRNSHHNYWRRTSPHIWRQWKTPLLNPNPQTTMVMNQYHNNLQVPTNIEPSIQTFETEIVWLYQRYKYRIPKNDPLKLTQYTLPTPILDHVIDTSNIKHSYFSSPATCSTKINQFYSPFKWDQIFRPLGDAFDHKWSGNGIVHTHIQE